jgi:hypothetical protein
VTTFEGTVGIRADIIDSPGGKVKVCVDGVGRGRGMICVSFWCCRTTLEPPFDVERVVFSSTGVSSSTSRLTTPNFGSPSAKNFMRSVLGSTAKYRRAEADQSVSELPWGHWDTDWLKPSEVHRRDEFVQNMSI